MATFIVKGKKGAATTPRELDALTVGSRSSCTLSLEDPLLAEIHCTLGCDGSVFYVEDCGTSTGTYVNGVAAAGRTALKDGDEIVAGMSRLKIAITAGKAELTATVKEADFFFDKKEDPLLWSKDETAFGKFRPMRTANVVALLLLIAALPFCFIGSVSEAVLDFGPLSTVHRISDSRFAADHAALKDDSKGCAACHDPYSGATVGRCAACHDEIVSASRHPFYGKAEDWKNGCAPCHLEHQGENAADMRGTAKPAMCKSCHPAELQAKLDAGTLTLADIGASLAQRGRTAAPIGTFRAEVAYDTFSHADHVKAGAQCSDCHERAATPLLGDAANPRREFARVSYESCGACHGPDSKHERAPRAADGAPAKRFRPGWHGTDDGGAKCLECHTTLHDKELKASDVVDFDLAYTFGKSRFHGEQFDATAKGKDDCTECHLNGPPPERRLENRPFRHGVHCGRLGGNDAAGRVVASRECLACHQEQEAALSLAVTAPGACYRGPEAKACAKCHAPSGDPAAMPVAAEPALSGLPRRKRTEFPHGKHLGPLADQGGSGSRTLADGCFSCHEFKTGDAGAFDAAVHTKAGAQSCLDCHKTHREIGGGSCADCHRAGDPSYSGKPLAKDWPKPSGFSHFSPGHADPADPSRTRNCAECHRDAASVDGAATLTALRIPDENDPSCRDCHIRQGARFHWR